jgi:hypothetical protein
MRARGPILTLLVVAVLAGVLLVVNLTRTPSADTADRAAAATTSVAPAAAPAAQRAAPAAAEQFPGQAKYTGYTDGNHAALAVTVRDNKVSAYLCDGKSLEAWYQGSGAGGKLDAKGRGANAITGSLSGGKLSGTVSEGGRSWTYTAAPASAPALDPSTAGPVKGGDTVVGQ